MVVAFHYAPRKRCDMCTLALTVQLHHSSSLLVSTANENVSFNPLFFFTLLCEIFQNNLHSKFWKLQICTLTGTCMKVKSSCLHEFLLLLLLMVFYFLNTYTHTQPESGILGFMESESNVLEANKKQSQSIYQKTQMPKTCDPAEIQQNSYSSIWRERTWVHG